MESGSRTKSCYFHHFYDEYVLPAFRSNSIDYLLKPILREDLQQSLKKLRDLKLVNESPERMTITESINIGKLLSELQAVLNNVDNGFSKRFLAKQGQKLLSVEVEEIMYFYNDEGFSFFKTVNGQKFMLEYTLDELADLLDPNQFFRINERLIVTQKAVEKINSYSGNQLVLTLKPIYNKETVLSLEKVNYFRTWMAR